MPEKLDRCVADVLKGWQDDPSTRPKTVQGKPVKSDDDLTSAAFAICNKTLDLSEAWQKILLEGIGPVITGIALTNRPHLPLPPASLVEIEGRKYIRIPFLRKGIFSHPKYGELVFDQPIFERMLENHLAGRSHYGVSADIRHRPELGALAWFTKDRAGFIRQEEDGKFGSLLIAYGLPTSEEAAEIVEKGRYAYGSIEFHPNFESNMVQPLLSGDDLSELDHQRILNEIQPQKLEASMEIKFGDLTLMLEEADGSFALTTEMVETLKQAGLAYQKLGTEAEKVKTLQDQVDRLSPLQDQVQQLEDRVAELTKQAEPEIPAEIKVQLEERDKRILEMQQAMAKDRARYALGIARKFRDERGYGHSPFFLETAEKALLLQEIGAGDNGTEVIRLEEQSARGTVSYLRDVICYMLENMPGQILLESLSEGANDKKSPLSDPDDLGGGWTPEALEAEAEKTPWLA